MLLAALTISRYPLAPLCETVTSREMVTKQSVPLNCTWSGLNLAWKPTQGQDGNNETLSLIGKIIIIASLSSQSLHIWLSYIGLPLVANNNTPLSAARNQYTIPVSIFKALKCYLSCSYPPLHEEMCCFSQHLFNG